ncbi:MAG: hypothetical protein HQ541_20505 [Mariniphaga sp.]|nr:hypothetical protein [Mariniphaga sp.]
MDNNSVRNWHLGICHEIRNTNFSRLQKALGENLARASAGMWVEALNFLDSFVYFSHQGEK